MLVPTVSGSQIQNDPLKNNISPGFLPGEIDFMYSGSGNHPNLSLIYQPRFHH